MNLEQNQNPECQNKSTTFTVNEIFSALHNSIVSIFKSFLNAGFLLEALSPLAHKHFTTLWDPNVLGSHKLSHMLHKVCIHCMCFSGRIKSPQIGDMHTIQMRPNPIQNYYNATHKHLYKHLTMFCALARVMHDFKGNKMNRSYLCVCLQLY